jgi:hypothetical protein
MTKNQGIIAHEPINRQMTEPRLTLIHEGKRLMTSWPKGAEFAEILHIT